jgi:transcriptional antiterminator NusG
VVSSGGDSMSDENATPLETPVLEPVADAAAPESEPAPASQSETAEHVPVVVPAHQADTEEHVPLSVSPLAALAEETRAEEPAADASEDSAERAPPPVIPEEVEAAPASAAEAVEPEPEQAKPKKKRTKKAAAAVEAEPEAEPDAEAAPAPVEGEPAKKWYVIKVQSGREESIKGAVERKIKIENLEQYFGRIEIPVEELVEKRKVKAKDKKTGETVYQEKNVTKKRKKYPGYLFAEVEFNNEILAVFRETSGVGDFVGASITRAPAPMPDHEVTAMLTGVKVKGGAPAGKVKVKLDYEKGDKVKIRDGAFSGMEGEVKHISEAKDASETPKVKVEVTIFGRPVEVELDYWQVDKA